MLTFRRNYFILAVILFIIEVGIALFVHDRFIRPYVGDVIVVMLIYCFIKSFIRLPVYRAALFVLLFAFTVETLQYMNVVEKLGLAKSRLAVIIIGNSFSWFDMLTYIAGIGIVLIAESVIAWKCRNHIVDNS